MFIFQTKKITNFLGICNVFCSAKITISAIENIRIIQKGQIIGSNDNLSAFENYKILMAS